MSYFCQMPPPAHIVSACDNVWEALAVAVLMRSVLDARAGQYDARAFVASTAFETLCAELDFDAAQWRRIAARRAQRAAVND